MPPWLQGTLDAVDCAGRTKQAVFEYARILRPGGVLLLTTCRDLESRQAQLSAWFHLKVQPCRKLTLPWQKRSCRS